MENFDNQINERVQQALKEKEEKDRFAMRFLWAFIGAVTSGYVVWSKLWVFSLQDNILFWAIGIGAVVGFFLAELVVLACVGLLGLIAYTWIQQNYVSGENYSIGVENRSLKNLSIKTISPVNCGTWKSKDNQDLIVTILPGETKRAFYGCQAKAFAFSTNGVIQHGEVRDKDGRCLELTTSLNLIYAESGWTAPAVDAFGEHGAIKMQKCK